MSGAGDELDSFANKPLEGLANLVTNYYTGGMAGYKDGKIGQGYTTQGLKEITGANAAEQANEMARAQFEKQTADALKDRENAKLADKNANILASQSAGATQNKGIKNTKAAPVAPIGDVQDFLGI